MRRCTFVSVCGCLALTALVAISALTITAAEPPGFSLVTEPAAKVAIRKVLEGDASHVGRTGDPMLDDVLSVLKNRGSVLDGSLLDPNVFDLEGRAPETNSRGPNSERAHAAEQLLKASRLLEGVETPDEARADLIARIRVEAVKLLSE